MKGRILRDGQRAVLDSAKKLTDEQLGKLTRRMDEVKRRANEGAIDFQWTLDELQRVAEGKSRVMWSPFEADKTQIGWELVEMGPKLVRPFSPRFATVTDHNSSYMYGDAMRYKARELDANLGQAHAEYLLENPGLLPGKSNDIVFPGTVWKTSDGQIVIPVIRWLPFPTLVFKRLNGAWGCSDWLVKNRH